MAFENEIEKERLRKALREARTAEEIQTAHAQLRAAIERGREEQQSKERNKNMEQKAKKYSELNRYERAMTNASLEQRLEAMANDLKQMALALGISIHVNATFHDCKAAGDTEETHSTVMVYLLNEVDNCTRRDLREPGDLFGIIEEAIKKTPTEE